MKHKIIDNGPENDNNFDDALKSKQQLGPK